MVVIPIIINMKQKNKKIYVCVHICEHIYTYMNMIYDIYTY